MAEFERIEKVSYLRIFTHNINKRKFMISCCGRPMISGKAMTKILNETLKSSLESEKNGFKKHLPALFHAIFFMPVLLICYHTVFLVQFYINLHLSVYQKAEIALTAAACAISAF